LVGGALAVTAGVAGGGVAGGVVVVAAGGHEQGECGQPGEELHRSSVLGHGGVAPWFGVSGARRSQRGDPRRQRPRGRRARSMSAAIQSMDSATRAVRPAPVTTTRSLLSWIPALIVWPRPPPPMR